MKALFLFLLLDKGWGVYPCCTENFDQKNKKPKNQSLFFSPGEDGTLTHGQIGNLRSCLQLSAHFSFIYATCCCPVTAQPQQDTRMKGRATNTRLAGLCFPTGAAGSKNDRGLYCHLPWGKMLIMEGTALCFLLPRGRKRDLWSGEIELFLPLKAAP